MPLTQPERAEILEQIKADFRLELGVDPLPRSVEYALCRALTGQSKGQYGAIAATYRDCFPDSASPEAFWRWAQLWIDQKPASPWQGTYRVTGDDATVLSAGQVLTRSDGATYTIDESATIGDVVSGYVDVAITAETAGSASNNDDFQPLVLSPPVLGADTEGVVQSTTVDGADVETAEDGLVRLLEVLRAPETGGGPGDYVRWTKEVSGVTRAWEFANLYGPNTVGVAFVRDNDIDPDAVDYHDILPSSGERAEVLAYLETKAPITVTVYVIELTALDVDITITDLDPDTVEIRAAVEAELADFFLREARPGGTMALSRISAAISRADDELSHVLTVPAAAVTSTSAQMPILGTVTYA